MLVKLDTMNILIRKSESVFYYILFVASLLFSASFLCIYFPLHVIRKSIRLRANNAPLPKIDKKETIKKTVEPIPNTTMQSIYI